MNLLKLFEHSHSWRRMTSKEDYGNYRSPHFGGYHGIEEEICSCGMAREVQGWQQWRYELDDAEAKVNYLKSVEPEGLK